MAQEEKSWGIQAVKGNATLPPEKTDAQFVHRAILLVHWLEKTGKRIN